MKKFKSILFWKGRSKGMIHTRDIKWDDLRYIFFPRTFDEKYGYLLSYLPEKSNYFKAIYPLVLAMDYEAKPKWCPRWFLRFLDVFGKDRSIVRVRNRRLYVLYMRLTKGIGICDWKTKWEDYDLRLYIHAPKHLQDLADDIENGFYSRGRQQELVDEIKKINPNASIIWGSIERLKEQLEDEKQKKS